MENTSLRNYKKQVDFFGDPMYSPEAIQLFRKRGQRVLSHRLTTLSFSLHTLPTPF